MYSPELPQQVEAIQMSTYNICLYNFVKVIQMSTHNIYFYKENQNTYHMSLYSFNPSPAEPRLCPSFANSVDQDQLAFEEASWSRSALFCHSVCEFISVIWIK